MAKKFGKFVMFSALAGAAAAGTYYYLQKKNEDPLKDMDDIDDFDDFDDDFDDDDDDMEMPHSKNRSYVSLDLESAKEIIGEKVIETIDKTKEKIVQFNVAEKLDKAKEFVEEITAPDAARTTSETTNESPSFVTPVEPTVVVPPATSVSSTYQDDLDADETEEFFDDDEEL